MGRASIIEAYIQRLLELKQPLTESILNAIAEEVGITSGELESINQQVQVHLTRGYNYTEVGDLDNAIRELTRAQSLNPVNLEVLNALANAYNQRYCQDIRPEDRQQALVMARRYLELNPNNREVLSLVKELEEFAGFQNLSLQAKPNIFILIGFLENFFSLENVFKPEQITRRTKTRITLLLLFLQQPIDASTVGWWMIDKLFWGSGGAIVVGITAISLSRLPVFSNPNVASESALVETAPDFDPGPNVPVAFNHPGLLIEPRLSRLGEYEGEPYYKLHGVVINDSGQDVRTLKLKVELLDGDGVTISTINQVAITSKGAIIRPGDTRAFELFHKITPALISVRVSVIDIEQVVGSETDAGPDSKRYSLRSFAAEDGHSKLSSRLNSTLTQPYAPLL